MNAFEAREELTKVISLAMTARRLLAGGKLVDLSAIEERVRFVCQAVAEMPREDAEALLEDMEMLIHRLDQLESELEERLEQCGGRPAASAGEPAGGD